MIHLSAALCVLILISPSYANEITQAPIELSLKAPQEVSPGDLVVLSVEESNATSFEWIVLPSTSNFLVIDAGRRAVFSATEGEFIFIIAAAKEDQVQVIHHKVSITGPVNGIASVIFALCEQVDPPRDDVVRLAQSFLSVASAMEQGTWTPVEIAKATKISNQAALGQSAEDWTPFAKGLATKLGQMAAEGELQTTADHITLWKEIAAALHRWTEENY